MQIKLAPIQAAQLSQFFGNSVALHVSKAGILQKAPGPGATRN